MVLASRFYVLGKNLSDRISHTIIYQKLPYWLNIIIGLSGIWNCNEMPYNVRYIVIVPSVHSPGVLLYKGKIKMQIAS